MTDRGNFEYESIESILSRAFAPVEPPARMYEEVESRLSDISLSAAEELSDWELAAMRDPRNWVRPAVALAAGGAAAGALVVMGLRHRKHDDDAGAVAVKALTDALGEAAEGAREDLKRAARDLTS
ncbi:MAG: hypothetical protein QM648_06415 [Solirubrobacterales bacterium]